MIHGLLFCGGSQGKSSLIIKLGAGAFQKNTMPEQKVFDSSLEFHRFFFFTRNGDVFFFYPVQLVCISQCDEKFLRWFQFYWVDDIRRGQSEGIKGNI